MFNAPNHASLAGQPILIVTLVKNGAYECSDFNLLFWINPVFLMLSEKH